MKTPLKTVLRNFLNHVEDLDARQRSNDDQYEVEFQRLKQLTDRLKEDAQYSCSHGHKEVNRPKNRYKDIVPFDFCRVILPEFSEIPGSDYINASYIKGASGACAYVAAQGPLPNTIVDFWRMIWACDIKVIIMACNQQEAGKYKCESYWPEEDEPRRYGTISVELVKENQICVDFLVRTLSVKQQEEMKLIYQFHYTTWPDHGVPVTVYPILELVRLVRDCQASETVPIVVHCSAGCGRTGTICAIDFVWACLRSGKLNDSFCLYDIVSEMRQQRIAMVQTKEQYILIHRAVASMFEQQLRVIDCHTYVNLDEDGEPLLWKGLRHEKVENANCLPTQAMNCSSALKSTSSNGGDPGDKNDQTSQSGTSIIENSALRDCSNKKNLLKDENYERLSNYSSKGGGVPFDSCLPKSYKGFTSDTSHLKSKESEVLSPSADAESKNLVDSKLNCASHEGDETIPFIDDDDETTEDVKRRPLGGRAYLNIPSCSSISKIINCFDPFVDKISVGTDESSPETESCESSSALYVSPKSKHPVPLDVKSDSVSLPCRSEVIPPSQNNLTTLKFAPALVGASHTRNLSDVPELSKLADSSELAPNKVKVTQGIHGERPKTSSKDESMLFKTLNTKPQISVPDSENKLNKTVTFHSNNNPERTTKPECKISSSVCDDSSVPKQIGKASVMRRPSIARIKALFEKSGVDNNEQGCEKRSLFRHHSHHISRAGSAPPSLDCVNRHSDIEKQSLLEMVTRKFRSSSVKSERELEKNKKPSAAQTSSSTPKKSGNSSFSHFKENISNLTRNVSLSFSKNSAKATQPFPQTKWHDRTSLEPDRPVTFDKTQEKITLHPSKDPPSNLNSKNNTQWYSVAPETVTKVYVKPPAETKSSESGAKNETKAPSEHGSSFIPHRPDSSSHVNKAAQSVNVSDSSVTNSSDKGSKFSIPLLYTTNKTDPKEALMPWCNSGDQSNSSAITKGKTTTKSTETSNERIPSTDQKAPVPISTVSSISSTFTATQTDKCKTENYKSESSKPRESRLEIQLAKSKFYSQLNSNVDRPPVLPMKKRVGLTSLNLIPDDARPSSESTVFGNSKFFWPSNSFGPSHNQSLKPNLPSAPDATEDQVADHEEKSSITVESENIEEPVKYTPETVRCVLEPVRAVYTENLLSEEQIGKKTAEAAPPALPKKMVLGKNKNFEFPSLLDVDDGKPACNTESTLISLVPEVPPDKNAKPDESEDKAILPTLTNSNDVYMNVNVVAKKNIEQIENTLRNHPRGAIIDLTSRQSYSMEEELALAVKELSEPVKKPLTQFRTAVEAKLAGYEVIWPESKQGKPTPVSKTEEKGSSRSSAGAPVNKSGLSRSLQPGDLLEALSQGKKLCQAANRTGLCYSPPLRRNVSSNFSLSKSQSCVTLDWQELEKKDVSLDSRSAASENKSTDTLVSEAVVELTTLLDELTTRTLSEDVATITKNDTSEVAKTPSGANSSCSADGSPLSAAEKSPEILNTDKSAVLQNNQQSKPPVRSCNPEAFAIAIKPLASTRNAKDEEIVFHFPPPPPIPPPPQDEPVQEIFEVQCKNGMLLISDACKERSDKRENDVAEAYIQTDASKEPLVGNDKTEIVAPMPLPRKTKQNASIDSHGQNKPPSGSVVQKPQEPMCSSKTEQILQDPRREEPMKAHDSGIAKPTSADILKTTFSNQEESYLVSDKVASVINQSSENREKNVPGNFSEISTQELPKNSTGTGEQLNTSHGGFQNSGVQTSFDEENVVCEQKPEVTKRAVNQKACAVPPRYENINLTRSGIPCSKRDSSSGEEKDLSHSAESLNLSADDAAHKSVTTYVRGDKPEQQSYDTFPIYGKIRKVPPSRICTVAPLQLKENVGTTVPATSDDNQSNKMDEKKRPIPSRKSERAPLPPSVRPRIPRDGEKASSLKRIPSRKHERAPQPPALSTSTSCTSLGPNEKSETWDALLAQNTHPQTHRVKHRLHALYENISEGHCITPSCKLTDKTQNAKEDSIPQPTPRVNHGLKHSHSDASVFLALRGGKLKHPHPKQPPSDGEQNSEAQKDRRKGSTGTSESSSDDSESSLRLRLSSQDAIEHQTTVSQELKRDIPMAPPRSKRRSTMEIHYLKNPDGKDTSGKSKQISVQEFAGTDCAQTSGAKVEEKPPAVPMKTKEAFEVPEEFRRKANTLPHQRNIDIMLNNASDSTSKRMEIREKPTSVLLRKELMHQESPTASPAVRKGGYKRRSVPAVSTGMPWCPEVKNVAPRKPLQ